MQEATDVMVMGHEGEDFDSLGSAMGVARMAAHLGKPVNIVVGQVAMSYEKLQELLPGYSEYEGLFLSAAQAETKISAKTLLFVVDTHRVFLTAAPQLLERVDRRVVIDHHRRAEDFIPSPMIVYLEPSIPRILPFRPESERLRQPRSCVVPVPIRLWSVSCSAMTWKR